METGLFGRLARLGIVGRGGDSDPDLSPRPPGTFPGGALNTACESACDANHESCRRGCEAIDGECQDECNHRRKRCRIACRRGAFGA